jgi:biopolymer transport protein ExbD
VESPAVEFKLPRVGSAEPVRLSTVIVAIDAAGRLYLGGRRIIKKDLTRRLKQIRKNNPTSVLVVKAHRDTRYERVVQVITAAAECGFRNIQSPVTVRTPESE